MGEPLRSCKIFSHFGPMMTSTTVAEATFARNRPGNCSPSGMLS